MSYAISITQSAVYTALRAFLTTVLPSIPIIKTLPNRTAWPPANPGFVLMTFLRRRRLNYNIETWNESETDPTTWSIETHFEVVMQLDFYGAAAGDWCATVESVWKSDTAVQALLPNCVPLYTNDSYMAPLEDEEDQYELRWTMEAVLQYNPVTTTPEQFMSEANLTVINVDQRYPAT